MDAERREYWEEQLVTAHELAVVHHGANRQFQIARSSEYEIMHVMEVSLRCWRELIVADEEFRYKCTVTGALHDILEDTDATSEDLCHLHTDVELAVELLTREKRDNYSDYIERIQRAPGQWGRVARFVKLQDSWVNLQRLPRLEAEDIIDRSRLTWYRKRWQHNVNLFGG